MIKMDGYDDCVIGIIEGYGIKDRIVYDRDKILKKHMAEGMTQEEALEFFEYNQLGAYAGEAMPVFFQPCTLEWIEQCMEAEDEE